MNRLPIEFEYLYSHFSVTDTVRTSHTQSQDSVEVYQVCVVNSCYVHVATVEGGVWSFQCVLY